jgi:ElaA protein
VDDVELHRASGTEISSVDLYAALVLRSQVFVVEQACTYLDPDGRDVEPGTTHLWFTTAEGTMAAYVRVLTEPTGGHRIGRVVTDAAHRGRRLAGRLLDEALAISEQPVVLDAQSHLTALYERHGFEPHGAEYVEDGIPHTPMRLR